MKDMPMTVNTLQTPDILGPKADNAEGEDGREDLTGYVARHVAAVLHLGTDLQRDVHLMLYGMDSLLFFRLLESMANELQISIAPGEAVAGFRDLTVNNLAALLGRALKTRGTMPPAGIAQALNAPIMPDAANRHAPFPLTDIQHAYWIGQLGVVGWGNVPCNAYAEFDRLDTGLDFTRFNRALQLAIRRHDMLRAVVMPNGEQKILKHVPDYELRVLDLRGDTAEEAERILDEIRREMAASAPQSDAWPLFEFRATRFGGNRVRFHINLDLLIFDGQSIQILFQDLAYFYENGAGFRAPLSLSFRDYVTAVAGVQKTTLYEESRRYWLDKMDSIPQPPELPMRKDMFAVRDFHFKSREFGLCPEEWQRFKQHAARSGITPPSAFLAAYAKVLGAWSRHGDFTVNLTQYNRHPLHEEVTEILGDFTSVLLVPVRNIHAESFQSGAQRIQNEILQGMEHRYFNGIEVMREMTKRQDGAPYMVPYVFTCITGIGGSIGDGGPDESTEALVGESTFMSVRTPQVVLDHQIREKSGSLRCRWDVVEELFPDGVIDDMFVAYSRLLKLLAADEAAWKRPVSIELPEAQKQRRIEANNTRDDLPEGLLHTFFRRMAAQRPEAPAITTSERSMSYGELDRRARRIAHKLLQNGALPNTLVAVVMSKGWEQVAAVLGVLYAGAAYLPISADFPEQRVLYLLENAEARLILIQPGLRDKFTWPEDSHVFGVENADDGLETPVCPTVQTPDDLAYVIYTSGSTGLPKGVMIDHRGAVNTVLDINSRFDVCDGDKVFALSGLNFDLSVYDIFGALSAGATLVIPDAGRGKDPSHWLEMITHEKVTVWNSVPALLQMLVEYSASLAGADLSSLRLALLSGDWIPPDLPSRLKKLSEHVEIVGMGGATEASIWSILYPIGEVPGHWKSIPYGYAMKNQRIYVLSDAMSNCPEWVAGQIHIGGVGLARGYWKDEEKTASAFVEHSITGERLYRTGDLGRYRPEGYIEFLGREDSQVKVGGHRIELCEIETALLAHPEVHEATVVVGEDSARHGRLVAYVVREDRSNAETTDLREFLGQRLPDYMIPPAIVTLEALPLTPNGKLDKKYLISQAARHVEAGRPRSAAPQSAMEQATAALWRGLLNCGSIGIHDNFFEMGGNSLLALRLHSKLREISPRELSIVNIFEYPTISALTRFMTAGSEARTAEAGSVERGSMRRERLKEKNRGRGRACA